MSAYRFMRNFLRLFYTSSMQRKNIIRPIFITDFIVAAVLLLGMGLLYELAIVKLHKPWQRIAIAVTLVVLFALIWAQLAVGIFS